MTSIDADGNESPLSPVVEPAWEEVRGAAVGAGGANIERFSCLFNHN